MTQPIVVTDSPFIDAETFRNQLSSLEYELVSVPSGDERAVADAGTAAAAIVVDVNTPVSAETIAALEEASVIARAGTGVDNIAVDAAADAGITVVNAPEYSTDEVATHALSLLLACRRQLGRYDREVADGEWNWLPERPYPRVRGSTLGVVSFGTIARRLVDLAAGFDLEVLAYDPYVDPAVADEYGVELVSFDELLARSDAVTIHAPLTDETRGLFDADAFAALPDHAVVVNVGRGGIVDEAALATALENGEIAGAGLDVMAEEPPSPSDSPLLDRDDVLLTPHAAWYSADSHAELNETVAADVRRVLQGQPPENPVRPASY
ncbi:C-terminal binding protein [Halopiger aswanensis]|uniref:D-3-phosphoglycerate dehydrogenase n=1 Tax=Halopiger aswanensis TaxID=148449 RepID=A0A3R7KIJ5_9EURY|nr:C-terminal binding protein [Halopiger aswanensis]RKD88120.1 D-3-phosphoglycerate dehydrogenase [Halopiger aswanensis]